MARSAMRISAASRLTPRTLRSIHGENVPIPDRERLIHLQLRRFAGCPFCSLHLHSVAERLDEIESAGIREVAVFHATREELLAHEPDIPFALVADPDRRLYREFGVERSARAVLDPRAWPYGLRGLLRRWKTLRIPPANAMLGRPADFLIAPDGQILAAKYGEHAYDQWSVDELLRLAQNAGGDRHGQVDQSGSSLLDAVPGL